MALRWLALTVLLLGADYGAWRWTTAAGQGTPALIAGLTLALLAAAIVWMAVLAMVSGLVRVGRGVARRGTPDRPSVAVAPEGEDASAGTERLAA